MKTHIKRTLTKSKLPGFRKDEAGSALLEATVVVPVLLAIGLGVVEFGNFFYQRHMIQAGVRDAARYMAALPRAHAGSEDDAEEIALTGELGTKNCTTTCRVSWWKPSATDYRFDITYPSKSNPITVAGTDYDLRHEDGGNIYSIRVETDVRYESLGFLTGFLNLTDITFTVTHEERHLGFR